MKSTIITRTMTGLALLAAAHALQPEEWSWITLANSAPVASATEKPRVIEIMARKFDFSPSEITLKKGEPVILRLRSEDRTHGFLLKPLGIDTDITADKNTDVALTPQVAGDYDVICDHYCGIGHGGMKMKVTVIE